MVPQYCISVCLVFMLLIVTSVYQLGRGPQLFKVSTNQSVEFLTFSHRFPTTCAGTWHMALAVDLTDFHILLV